MARIPLVKLKFSGHATIRLPSSDQEVHPSLNHAENKLESFHSKAKSEACQGFSFLKDSKRITFKL